MITLRRATEDDQPRIRWMVLTELLNPRDLHWQNFLIAEEDERIAGIGQVRLHETPQGIVKELGSLVVLSEYRGQGVGAALVAALEERAGCPLYLMCAPHNAAYYQRLGYTEVDDPRIAAAILPPRPIMWFIYNVLRSRLHVMVKI